MAAGGFNVHGAVLAAGFDVAGICAADAANAAGPRLFAFLGAGHHGTMDWLAREAPRRARVAALWPAARFAILAGASYAPDEDPRAAQALRSSGAVSAYARRRDYHDVLKGRLKQAAAAIARGLSADVKVFVDTAPLMEKPLAQAAGLGWQGKHTNLVSRAHGSWLFLGAILTDAAIAADAPETDHCGSCTRCLDACPTAAFPAPYQLDARLCLAYLSIEHKGSIPLEFREAMGNRVFGCDDCLAVCPWNRFAAASRDARLAAHIPAAVPLGEFLALDDAGFRARFAGTPVKRTGRAAFLRNCLIAAGNSADPALAPAVAAHAEADDEVVREAAQWALARLATARADHAA